MDISARNIPAFLVNCGAYHRYLNKALSGEVVLPAYEQGPNGVIVIHGEVFCRVAGCDKGQVPTSATNNLRAHLRRHHGLVLARTPCGAPQPGGKGLSNGLVFGPVRGQE
ncbi:unnamed protein product [Penicillium bialowiezense]